MRTAIASTVLAAAALLGGAVLPASAATTSGTTGAAPLDLDAFVKCAVAAKADGRTDAQARAECKHHLSL